jgi:hypothetical protein
MCPWQDREAKLPYFASRTTIQGETIMLGTVLLILLILILLGAIPAWPHSRNWGYAPSGGIGLVLIIVLILVLMRGI